MNRYVQFRETNYFEGEDWYFYIPVEGNEEAIEDLRTLVDYDEADLFDEDGAEYSVTSGTLTEDQADTLVVWGGETQYMPMHNKLEGKLSDVPYTEALYKGGITKFMSPKEEQQ